MDKVDIEKAQRLLDQGMRRGEIAIRMGVTYNVISGMIARKVLKVPEPGKRCYAEYKPEYSGLRVPPIRNGIPTKRRMIPTSFLHAIRRNVLSVRK